MKKLLRLAGFTLFSILVFSTSVPADPPRGELLDVKSKNLLNLIVSIEHVASEIEATQAILASPDSLGREGLIKLRIDELSRKMANLDENFDLLATGVNFGDEPGGLQDGFSWNQELKQLIGPLIKELQDLTLRPREIEKLKSDVAFYEERIELADEAINNLNKLIGVSGKSEPLRERLLKSVKKWLNRKNEWEALRNIGAVQLEVKERDQSITKSIQDIPRIFFKSHGHDGLIALLIFIFSCVGFYKLHGIIKKYNHIQLQARSFYGRIFELSYVFFAMVFSILATLASLYLLNNWVLLSVGIIFILGILWASKQTFPKLWIQIRLILNLGPVREGELVVYNGLIYKVVSINLYTTLENPLIQGGLLRIPIGDIMYLRSRPLVENEPWFPSAKGDWVLLGDNRHGKIIVQTPETVKVKCLGGMEISYNTSDFLGLAPMNLSSGFRLSIGFGLDYLYQSDITEKIPAILEKGIMEEIEAAGFTAKTSSIRVYFKTAAASSLDLEVIASFNETAGRHYSMLERVVNRACVDVCNKQNWTIPFAQMTVHMADPDQ